MSITRHNLVPILNPMRFSSEGDSCHSDEIAIDGFSPVELEIEYRYGFGFGVQQRGRACFAKVSVNDQLPSSAQSRLSFHAFSPIIGQDATGVGSFSLPCEMVRVRAWASSDAFHFDCRLDLISRPVFVSSLRLGSAGHGRVVSS